MSFLTCLVCLLVGLQITVFADQGQNVSRTSVAVRELSAQQIRTGKRHQHQQG